MAFMFKFLQIFSVDNIFLPSSKMEWIKEGFSISLIGISVVFLGLIMLFSAMKLFLFFINLQNKKSTVKIDNLIIRSREKGHLSGEIVAAIAMAIHQNQEQFHDLEETILTLNRITRPYSPWSSKIHVLRKPVR